MTMVHFALRVCDARHRTLVSGNGSAAGCTDRLGRSAAAPGDRL